MKFYLFLLHLLSLIFNWLTRKGTKACPNAFLSWGKVQGPAPQHTHTLGREQLENNPEEKDLGVSVDERINISRQLCLQPRKPNTSWVASREVWPAGQGRWFCPSTHESPPRVLHQLWDLQHKKDIELLEWVSFFITFYFGNICSLFKINLLVSFGFTK